MKRKPSARVSVSWSFYELLAELRAKSGKTFIEITDEIANKYKECMEIERVLESRAEDVELTEGDLRWPDSS